MSQAMLERLKSFRDVNIDGAKMPKIQHFSFWSFGEAVCMKRWENVVYKKRQRVDQDSRVFLEGAAVHNAIEDWIKGDRTWDLKQGIIDKFLKLEREAKILIWREPTEQIPNDREFIFNRVQKMADWVVQFFEASGILDRDRYILYPEYTFKTRVTDYAYITGRIDLWVWDRQEEDSLVLDWKCVAREESNHIEQLMFYALAVMGFTLRPVRLSSFVMPLLETVSKPYVFSTEQLDDMLSRIERRGRALEKCLQTREFPMYQTNSNCKFCPMLPECGEPPKVKYDTGSHAF